MGLLSSEVCALQAINGSVEMIEAVNAKVDVTRLVGVRAFSLDRVLAMEPAFPEVKRRSLPPACAPFR